ncbi:hypothetical protein [Rhodoferax fermentans]|uniref:Uncharacterized protein n=1 Tax=Rhodoferax fermentans TaxID=28066 RepID=A0A1T1ANT9_RHOFE|nr:hypothetical protein [Rhodoferax fermentans]OOV05779.1 hypothetical protein RF819_02805 [Rhodoferax fermentans]
MFNRSFNLTNFVKDIPSLALRKAAWLSLVGSVNASLFGAADAIVQKLQAAGYTELKELSTREIKALCSGPETGASVDVIAANKKLYKLHVEWRAELQHTTVVSSGRKADDTLGSIASTITMMTGPQKERDINREAVPLLASLGITVTPDMIAAAKKQRLMDDNHFANMRKQRAGMIEYIIDNLFASNDSKYDGDDDENYSTLDVEVKEYLANKLMASMNKAMTTSVNNTLFGRAGDNVLGVGDYMIAQRIVPQLVDAMTGVAKPKAAKAPRAKKVKAPVVQRAPRPTQKSVVTTVNDNGFKVTRPVEAATA